MQPIGTLMVEHRLIERMLALMEGEISRIRSSGRADSVLIGSAVDFLRTYADLTHHGKEEDIFFRDLNARDLTPLHREMMEELIKEHLYVRSMVKVLDKATVRYTGGDEGALEALLKAMTVPPSTRA